MGDVMDGMTCRRDLLIISLEAAVPLHILEIRQRGGLDGRDVDRARQAAGLLAEKGDVLQFGGKPGAAAKVFNELAFALAVMAFCPGGVTFAGAHWEAQKDI